MLNKASFCAATSVPAPLHAAIFPLGYLNRMTGVQDKSHTIILVQRTQAKNSRTFLDYETLSGAVDGPISSYEQLYHTVSSMACIWIAVAVFRRDEVLSWVHCAGICALFERDLKEKYPNQRELTYDVQQLFAWLDRLVTSHALCIAHTLLSC